MIEDKNNFVVEYCSECEHENEFRWNTKIEGFKAHCSHCGAILMLCNECLCSDDIPIRCYYNDTPIGECARTTRK